MSSQENDGMSFIIIRSCLVLRTTIKNLLVKCWCFINTQATANNYLYQHEVGFNDDGSEKVNVFVNQQTWIYKMAKTFLLKRLIPDIKFLTSDSSTNVNIETSRNFSESLSSVATSTSNLTTKQST